MASNKITGIRIANLAESPDKALHLLIDYDNLKIHRPEVVNYPDSLHQYFENMCLNGRVTFLHVLEDGRHVAIHFTVTIGERVTTNFHVYRFDEKGMLTEIWTNSESSIHKKLFLTSQEESDYLIPIDYLTDVIEYLKEYRNTGNHKRMNGIELCVADAGLTLTGTIGHTGEGTFVYFDLIRWENGKVLEYWNVTEPLPPPEIWKNEWGKFNFF